MHKENQYSTCYFSLHFDNLLFIAVYHNMTQQCFEITNIVLITKVRWLLSFEGLLHSLEIRRFIICYLCRYNYTLRLDLYSSYSKHSQDYYANFISIFLLLLCCVLIIYFKIHSTFNRSVLQILIKKIIFYFVVKVYVRIPTMKLHVIQIIDMHNIRDVSPRPLFSYAKTINVTNYQKTAAFLKNKNQHNLSPENW
ncbi:hypothetical protein AGLY_003213 [Aphis glycines]|uniref:Transmembrane protein n=1 Tax=Aphis glycines TaxID=307491 RepID=A0A6G0U4U2_APHGL|nr:hypothetical protein AGLY_003213 [Aphis glycines]